MDSGLAAVLGAAIGFLGSLLGTVIVPLLTRRREEAQQELRARRDALRRIVPVVVKGVLEIHRSDITDEAVVDILQTLAELQTWLTKDEWQVGHIVTTALFDTDKSDEAGPRTLVLTEILPAWARGEMTATEVQEFWEEATGDMVKRITPAQMAAAWERAKKR